MWLAKGEVDFLVLTSNLCCYGNICFISLCFAVQFAIVDRFHRYCCNSRGFSLLKSERLSICAMRWSNIEYRLLCRRNKLKSQYEALSGPCLLVLQLFVTMAIWDSEAILGSSSSLTRFIYNFWNQLDSIFDYKIGFIELRAFIETERWMQRKGESSVKFEISVAAWCHIFISRRWRLQKFREKEEKDTKRKKAAKERALRLLNRNKKKVSRGSMILCLRILVCCCLPLRLMFSPVLLHPIFPCNFIAAVL